MKLSKSLLQTVCFALDCNFPKATTYLYSTLSCLLPTVLIWPPFPQCLGPTEFASGKYHPHSTDRELMHQQSEIFSHLKWVLEERVKSTLSKSRLPAILNARISFLCLALLSNKNTVISKIDVKQITC